jgi:hypothetical protein
LEKEDARSAQAAFEEAHAAMTAIGAEGYATDALAGIARCLLAQGDYGAAQSAAEAVWSYLSNGKGGMEFPLLAHETCAAAFEMNGNAVVAGMVGRAGYALLMEEANKISDPRWRESFLEEIAEHRALVQRQSRSGQA